MLTGSIVALITPMKEDLSVNYEKLAELIEWHIAQQTDCLLVLGTTGESPTLSSDEESEIVRFTLEKVAGRIPVMVGSGSNATAQAVAKSQEFAQLGADYLLVITPYYNKTSPRGLLQHFTTIAQSVDKPIILYNVPSRTGMNIPLDVLKEVAKIPNIVGIKEASGDLGYLMQVATLLNDNFALYSGNDDMVLPILSLGGAGVISVWANLMPKTVHEMVQNFKEGKSAAALATQLKHLPLIDALFSETNPIPIKAALNIAGKNVGSLRLPLVDLSPSHYEHLKAEMAKLEEEQA
ncbi:4-hydroxy-tetrahydrodipicolinate synthase [Enterococcus nangangensis]|uniref:4-hydroxy-tetrahydrodipicolinate synthase n=1 Tax=Enterococcus nangangensis TaxID=2559926 RepID=UPI0010F78DD4|nr:4-hydroxy-tetrahydrodipicolinate synthase [Enterococcus nangangensis]